MKNLKDQLQTVLDVLFEKYLEHVTDVSKITNAMIGKKIINSQSDIINDHIAFRTLGVKNLGIASLEKVFLNLGYVKKDYYYFEAKKLDAYWYSPPSIDFPRIFISELRVKDLPQNVQKIIHHYSDQVTEDPVSLVNWEDRNSIEDFFYSMHWEVPTLSDYETLENASEYAAWVIYNQYYLNHYTISIHRLPSPYNNMDVFKDFLIEIGIKMNTAGGIIKTSEDGLLRQCSSVSSKHLATFADNKTREISGSYVEFAERSVLPQYQNLPENEIQDKHRRDGFEAGNADKIFESTYSKQTDQ